MNLRRCRVCVYVWVRALNLSNEHIRTHAAKWAVYLSTNTPMWKICWRIIMWRNDRHQRNMLSSWHFVSSFVRSFFLFFRLNEICIFHLISSFETATTSTTRIKHIFRSTIRNGAYSDASDINKFLAQLRFGLCFALNRDICRNSHNQKGNKFHPFLKHSTLPMSFTHTNTHTRSRAHSNTRNTRILMSIAVRCSGEFVRAVSLCVKLILCRPISYCIPNIVERTT